MRENNASQHSADIMTGSNQDFKMNQIICMCPTKFKINDIPAKKKEEKKGCTGIIKLESTLYLYCLLEQEERSTAKKSTNIEEWVLSPAQCQ